MTLRVGIAAMPASPATVELVRQADRLGVEASSPTAGSATRSSPETAEAFLDPIELGSPEISTAGSAIATDR